MNMQQHRRIVGIVLPTTTASFDTRLYRLFFIPKTAYGVRWSSTIYIFFLGVRPRRIPYMKPGGVAPACVCQMPLFISKTEFDVGQSKKPINQQIDLVKSFPKAHR